MGDTEEVQTSSSGTTVTAYYYANGKRIAVGVNGTIPFLASDALGSAAVTLSGSSAAPSAAQLYAPYGGVRYASGAMPGSYGFTGQRQDATTGLYYLHARYLDPVLGAFTSVDTILQGGGFDVLGLSRYAYVEGNPIIKTDPTGHDDWWNDGCGGCTMDGGGSGDSSGGDSGSGGGDSGLTGDPCIDYGDCGGPSGGGDTRDDSALGGASSDAPEFAPPAPDTTSASSSDICWICVGGSSDTPTEPVSAVQSPSPDTGSPDPSQTPSDYTSSPFYWPLEIVSFAPYTVYYGSYQGLKWLNNNDQGPLSLGFGFGPLKVTVKVGWAAHPFLAAGEALGLGGDIGLDLLKSKLIGNIEPLNDEGFRGPLFGDGAKHRGFDPVDNVYLPGWRRTDSQFDWEW